MHDRLIVQLETCLSSGVVPTWMTKGRTVLIIKDLRKGNNANNYRPITCLPMIWKLQTGVIAEEMNGFLEHMGLLPEEQKGCRKNARGSNDLLFIGKLTLKEAKNRKKNLAMAWMDYKKAFEMVPPHSWILECMDLFGIAENIKRLLMTSMKSWKTELTSCGEVLAEIRIRRGIFQGDSLSPIVIRNVPHTFDNGAEKGKCRLSIHWRREDQSSFIYGRSEVIC